MPTYLDLGAQRVQDWIMATPKLTHLRGASRALELVTGTAAIEAWLTTSGLAGCAVAPEAGEKGGVVVLTCPDAATAERAALSLLAHLQRELPRVPWAGWWTDADRYLAAYVKAETDAPGVRRIAALPAAYDLPVLAQCDECRQEPAPGRDCAARARHADDREDLLLAVPGDLPTDFDDLARRGGLGPSSQTDRALGRRDSRNHLALVKADGNKVGQVFSEIAQHTHRLPELSAHAVADLAEATRTAVLMAARHPGVTDPDALVRGCLAHYVGGDDVLASVPAAHAWRFAVELGTEFGTLRATWHRRLNADLPPGRDDALKARLTSLIDDVSLGIGLVFARAGYPLAATNRVATTALGAAKKAADGRFAAIAWVDLSSEGVAGATPDLSTPTWQQWVTVREAKETLDGTPPKTWAAASELFGVPPAGRYRLAQKVREAGGAGGVAAAAEAATGWCAATGRSHGALFTDAGREPFRLLAWTSLARWWPTATLDEETSR